MNRLLYHGVDLRVQLVLGEVHVEAGAHALDGGGARGEAGELGAWNLGESEMKSKVFNFLTMEIGLSM